MRENCRPRLRHIAAPVDRDVDAKIVQKDRDIAIAPRPHIVKLIESPDHSRTDFAVIVGAQGDPEYFESRAIVQLEKPYRQVSHRMPVETTGYIGQANFLMPPNSAIPESERWA